jgi:hypothetical protein
MLKYRWVVAGGKEEELPFPNDRSAYQVLFEYTKGLPAMSSRWRMMSCGT